MLHIDTPCSRRHFLKGLGGAGVISALPNFARASPGLVSSDVVTILILHTTDLHGHILPAAGSAGALDVGGLDRCVTQIRRWRRSNPNTVLIDIGDVYQGTD